MGIQGRSDTGFLRWRRKCLQVAREANAELLELPPEWEATDPAALLAAVANELHSAQEATRLSALLWLNTLLSRSQPTVRPALGCCTWPDASAEPPAWTCHAENITLLDYQLVAQALRPFRAQSARVRCQDDRWRSSPASAVQVLAHLDVLLPSLFDALHAPSERVVVEALSVQAAIAADDPQQFRTLMQELIDRRAHGPAGAPRWAACCVAELGIARGYRH